MSWNALLRSVRDQLRASTGSGGLGYATAACEITPDGRPAPRAGKFFVAVHQGGRQQIDEEGTEETYAVNVTVSMRVDGPWDRIGPDLLALATLGVNDRAAAIRANLTNNQYKVMNYANVLFSAVPDGSGGSGLVNGFVEPLWYRGEEGPTLVGGGWFHADDGDQDCGVTLTMRFADARRIQLIGSTT